MCRVFTLTKLALVLPTFLFLALPAYAKPGASTVNQSHVLLAQVTEKETEAAERLQQMTPEEVAVLDKTLAQALRLYYDRHYAKSLAIFKEIASIVETMDIMFWLGQSAMKAGETVLAIQKFNEMLDLDPTLHRVRLDLATCYFLSGRYVEAKSELEAVLRVEPPEQVQKNINKLLAAIEERTRKVFGNLRFSQSIQRDSNITSGPEEERLPVTGGTIILEEKQKELKDWVTVSDLYGNILYDLGALFGLEWNTAGSFYRSYPFEYHEFGYLQAGATTGPWWVGKRAVLKLPFGYSYSEYGHEHLFDTTHFTPTCEFHLTNRFSIKALFSYEDERYEPPEKEIYDSVRRLYELSPSFYFNNRRDIVTLAIGHENSNAREDRWSYEAMNYSVSYFKKIKTHTEFYARYKYTDREFDTKPLLYTQVREDSRHSFYVVISRNVMDRFFVSFHYSFLDNNSNAGLYEFDRQIYGVSAGVTF